jgi:hypothetical protein
VSALCQHCISIAAVALQAAEEAALLQLHCQQQLCRSIAEALQQQLSSSSSSSNAAAALQQHCCSSIAAALLQQHCCSIAAAVAVVLKQLHGKLQQQVG